MYILADNDIGDNDNDTLHDIGKSLRQNTALIEFVDNINLFEAGAKFETDLNAENNNGRTALDLVSGTNPEIVELLKAKTEINTNIKVSLAKNKNLKSNKTATSEIGFITTKEIKIDEMNKATTFDIVMNAEKEIPQALLVSRKDSELTREFPRNPQPQHKQQDTETIANNVALANQNDGVDDEPVEGLMQVWWN